MKMSARDEYWMNYALYLAKIASQKQEVPVGAVLVRNDEVIGEGYNRPISLKDPTAHAEVVALREGAIKTGNYRLPDTCLYVTLEPCVMCVGALVHARIKRLVFGANDQKAGAVVTQSQLLDTSFLNHRVLYQGGLLKEECSAVIKQFFQAKR